MVDIFTNIQINLIGLLDCNYQRDVEDISHLIYYGKFCLSALGKKIVCKINETARGDSLLTVSRLCCGFAASSLFCEEKFQEKRLGPGFHSLQFRRNSY